MVSTSQVQTLKADRGLAWLSGHTTKGTHQSAVRIQLDESAFSTLCLLSFDILGSVTFLAVLDITVMSVQKM